jgi:SAM-dependent methyltransferase
MRTDAINLEDGRLKGLNLENYPWYNERHRIFPQVLNGKKIRRVLDIAAGVGVVGKRIQDQLNCFMLCNDISSESLQNLKRNNLRSISFDLDDSDAQFPFADESFDAVISLATVEHIINLDHHLNEINRILAPDGYFYISAPNYSGIQFSIPFLLTGRTFHNPLVEGLPKYEFYAHVRYFTYKTLLEFVASFGFKPRAVYLPLPERSSRFMALSKKSRLMAKAFRYAMWFLYKCLPPRWAFHPILCFSKSDSKELSNQGKPQKIIL